MPEIIKQITNTISFNRFEVNILDSAYPIKIPEKNIQGISIVFFLDFRKKT